MSFFELETSQRIGTKRMMVLILVLFLAILSVLLAYLSTRSTSDKPTTTQALAPEESIPVSDISYSSTEATDYLSTNSETALANVSYETAPVVRPDAETTVTQAADVSYSDDMPTDEVGNAEMTASDTTAETDYEMADPIISESNYADPVPPQSGDMRADY